MCGLGLLSPTTERALCSPPFLPAGTTFGQSIALHRASDVLQGCYCTNAVLGSGCAGPGGVGSALDRPFGRLQSPLVRCEPFTGTMLHVMRTAGCAAAARTPTAAGSGAAAG